MLMIAFVTEFLLGKELEEDREEPADIWLLRGERHWVQGRGVSVDQYLVLCTLAGIHRARTRRGEADPKPRWAEARRLPWPPKL